MSKGEARAIQLALFDWGKATGESEPTVAIAAMVGMIIDRYGTRVSISRVRMNLDKMAKEAMRLDAALDGLERGLNRRKRPKRVQVRFINPTVNPQDVSCE
ncbi:MAG: hypothetical protein G01um101420_503 [Parcubacteria group bacterium Gr01-1014_20]|nr:MAG: hypothetical protein G01um101420_503 [Parcubacteria group bacterium Gr01-1014_20]